MYGIENGFLGSTLIFLKKTLMWRLRMLTYEKNRDSQVSISLRMHTIRTIHGKY